MTTYLALFRSMNVGGKNSVKMETLRQLFEDLGFYDVHTYIQSGNVLFKATETAPFILAEVISKKLIHDLGLQLEVQIKSLACFKRIIAMNPYKDDLSKNESCIHVTFLAAKPFTHTLENIVKKKSSSEEFLITDEAVFLYCPDGYGKSKLTNQFLETQLGVVATTRNWKTSLALRSLAKQLGAE